jgi:hypothetical protein
VQVFPDFISVPEQEALLEWASTAPMRPRNLNGDSGLREVIYFTGDELPELVTIYDRIADHFDVHDRKHDEQIGMMVRYHEGARTLEHIDRKSVLGGREFRSNIVVQNAEEGGEFEYKGEVIPTPERALFVFDASELHAVLTTKKGMRIVYRWGWKDL